MRVEFYDEADGRTRLEVRQWLPEDYVAPPRGVGARVSPSWTPYSPAELDRGAQRLIR
jgi:hypothetical protein